MNNQNLRKKVESLIANKDMMDHHIARDTGLTLSAVQRIRKGQANLDNISLSTAEKLADYEDNFKPSY